MKKLLKIIGVVIGFVIVVALVFLVYFNIKYPDVQPAPAVSVERTPERIERGRYLANSVTVCIDCHSTRDWSRFSGPIVRGTEGKGGEMFTEEAGGVPGTLYASNITPYGIGDYSDGELLRTFTTGVTKHNRALFPLMPYMSYNHLTQEDAYSIVAYVRSLGAIENNVGESSLNFPLNFIVKTMPLNSFTPSPEPDRSNPLEYGRYLTGIAGCGDCHSPAVKGARIPGMDFAGGFEFVFPGGVVRSLNITPDSETGIGEWSKDDFIARFRAFASKELLDATMEPDEFNTPMPWTMYAGMTDDDLGAIYEFLRTVKPVQHQVAKFTPKQ